MVQSYFNVSLVDVLSSHNDRKIPTLVIVFFIALFVRLLPVTSTGLPYNYGSWVYLQQIKYVLQHEFVGHVLDFFNINSNTDFSSVLLSRDIIITPYVAPLICSFVIFPIYFLTKKISGDHNASVFASLLAAVSGIFANQTNHLSSESIALLLTSFIVFFSYDAMVKRSSKKLVLLLISCLLLSFTNHSASFLVLYAFGVIFITSILSKLKLTIHILLPFILMIALLFFQLLFDPVSSFLTTNMIGGSLAIVVSIVSLIFIFRWRAKPEFTFKRGVLWSGSSTIIIASLITVYATKLAPINQLNDVLISLSFHLIPYSIILIFPGLLGIYTHLSKTENALNRIFTIIWCVTPLIVGFMMFFPNMPLLDFKLCNYLLLGAFSMIGIGLSTLLSSGEKKWKPVKGFVTSYFLLALAIMSFPLAIQMFNHNQFYYLPEVNAANWVSIYVPTPTVVDTDYRMGVLLRYVIEDGQFILGDESSWLGEVTQSEVIFPIEEAIEYVVITDSMLIHGLVRQKYWLPIPLREEVVEYLDNSPKIDRVYSNGEVTIYKVSD